MGTPAQDRQFREDSHQWHMLLDELNLPHDTSWRTIANAMQDWRTISDGAEAEIARLTALLAEARAGVLEPAFCHVSSLRLRRGANLPRRRAAHGRYRRRCGADGHHVAAVLQRARV